MSGTLIVVERCTAWLLVLDDNGIEQGIGRKRGVCIDEGNPIERIAFFGDAVEDIVRPGGNITTGS